MYVKVTEEKSGTYAIRSQMFECVLLIVFRNLCFLQHTNINEFRIFSTFVI